MTRGEMQHRPSFHRARRDRLSAALRRILLLAAFLAAVVPALAALHGGGPSMDAATELAMGSGEPLSSEPGRARDEAGSEPHSHDTAFLVREHNAPAMPRRPDDASTNACRFVEATIRLDRPPRRG